MERTDSIQLDIPDFSNSVLSHLNQLRMQGRLCDIVVNVQGQSFRAHKVVLAASSPYFRDHMSLSEMSTVSIAVIRNPSVFEQLLSFCYTGRLCLQLADIISYLTAASFLQMQHIIDRCTQILEGIHFKISLADVEAELGGGEQSHRGGGRGLESGKAVAGPGSAATGSRSISPRHGSHRAMNTRRAAGTVDVRDLREVREVSPPGESMSPQIVEHSSSGPGGLCGPGGVGTKEPILRINRAGQWYVETGPEAGRGNDEGVRVVEGMRIKTERLEEWMGVETQASGEEGSSAEEVAAMMIDTTGHRNLGHEGFAAAAAPGQKSSQPSSSISERDRFSPTGSVVVTAERQRAKSESPGRVDDQRQPTSQGEEQAVFDMGGYEEYLREQVGDRWFRYNPRLTCIYCCKSFNQKGSLDRHMRLHMGITPFACRICGKKYTRKDQLEYHIRKHTGNKPFHCHVCGKSFPFQAILNQHFRKNHPGCAPQEGSHSASPETTTTVSSRGGPNEDESSSQEDAGGGSGGDANSFGEAVQPSVSTTGPD
ncbi:zinc finger and BTB domain-containing protein 37 isoform X1 [Scleropages formosus]|uniref:Zinc finger and BTB domain containing 37 n=1 Tax=Scleropages formosus TaxID=113540 RepID=A0A8C9VPE8_SCLFO|nr:zinc finger and BTB domain-containing protein 37 isoform X1 [Scleropages formosus]XP_029106451.1 zinc finger and BTB domain-containing protein 37 isoform X1 [Scleropages formosus]